MQAGEVLEFSTGAMVPCVRLGQRTTAHGTVAVTSDRVIFFSTKIGGFESQAIDYDLIASVDFKKGMLYGELDIAAAGDHA
ncbi:MAG: PH domain-containing protein, partial [Pseudonocardiales bacterium]|nr:PH domain-containing protein [Pseudonocardiales bacterium]